MSDVEEFIDALNNGKTGDANNIFSSVMSSKINTALNARKIEIADRVYNGVTDDLGQEDADFQESEI